MGEMERGPRVGVTGPVDKIGKNICPGENLRTRLGVTLKDLGAKDVSKKI